MTREELAAQLTGRTIGQEITRAEIVEAQQSGLVVVFCASDGLLEFRGAIDAEVEAWGGTQVLVLPEGLWQSDSCEAKCCHYRQAEAEALRCGWIIEADWDPGDGYSWKITTMMPHATFEVVEEDEPFCQGLVFRLEDAKASHPAARSGA